MAKKFSSIKNEFATLISSILIDPKSGISIGNNCFKIRLAIGSKGKGKSGGARVVTYIYVETETVYLLTIYDKGEKSELKEMIEGLELLPETYRRQ